MLRPLTATEVRVLGCLAEKELATPEYYPLSLNALVNACNQKSNRDPVMQLTAEDVAEAIAALRPLGLVMQSNDGGRVAKFAHNLSGKLHLVPAELAILAELLLRGPQTPGELRQRTARMHAFDSLESLERSVEEMLQRQQPILTRLPRQPGRKEQRIAHLLAGEPEVETAPAAEPAAVATARERQERLDRLEQAVEQLRNELAGLRAEFERFKKEFE
ncbi:hypothetical protein EDC39_1023 [Geothermobacter ehrlichii]|uniref:Uncharacterized protein n=1 Tax=Geothermobacter ehrlichii TaxID=213224 RepID=A0A5D3WP57_9BACT|nr:YceH family protein [Geothermobacter ehrlichii]TYO99481.1 hypothetical protein EDC39_1023 [Geothermobacter ehrlichii]